MVAMRLQESHYLSAETVVIDRQTALVSRRRTCLPANVPGQPLELAHAGRRNDQRNPLPARADF